MPRGPRKFEFLFAAAGLTRYGGLVLFRQFCKSLKLRYFLQRQVHWPSYHHRNYHPADLFLTHIFAIVAGIGRIENTQSLIHNGLVPPLLGLPNFPHRDTLRTFLWRFDQKSLQSLERTHDKVRTEFFARFGAIYSAVVDADTTALTVFGHQEASEIGYNPRYRGKRSYAPIISSEGRTGLSLGIQLRSGHTHSSTGALPFLRAMLDKLPTTIASSRARVRLDGGFYNKDIFDSLNREHVGYVIVARMTKPLKKRMVSARHHEFAKGWEAAEFTYTPFHWHQEHRFVAIRRPKALEPEDVQRRLFTFKNYTYHRAMVTNLELTPEAVYRFYCDRGSQELLIREFKDSYHMAQIPTRNFCANATYLETVLWAYDLVVAFRFLCLPPEIQHWNIHTLRRELWWLPAQWVKHGNRNILWLPARYSHQNWFLKIQSAAARNKSLI